MRLIMESVKGTFVAKGGQREEGSVGALRRKKPEARLEAAKMERKLKKVARERTG